MTVILVSIEWYMKTHRKGSRSSCSEVVILEKELINGEF